MKNKHKKDTLDQRLLDGDNPSVNMLPKKRRKKQEVPREFFSGKARKEYKNRKFSGNSVSTTRYTYLPIRVFKKPFKLFGRTMRVFGKTIPQVQLWFPIQNLLEQFGRIANLYFLLIACLQMFTDLSPTGRESTIIPLTVVVLFSMLKDGVEDLKRQFGDVRVNTRQTLVFENGAMKLKKWKDVKVGDIVRVNKSEKFPCDLIVISSSGVQGLCYIETSSLDGETNLKIRRAPKETQETYDSELKLNSFSARIECENPNKALYNFEGFMELLNTNERIPIEPLQILLRGSSLRNTDYVFGIAVFTGHDTKLMNNQNQAPHKVSKIEKQTNRFIFFILGTLVLLCIICMVGTMIIEATQISSAWYLKEDGAIGFGSVLKIGVSSFITFLILFNNLVPISLYVSVEIAKFIQGLFMSSDIRMYFKPNDVGCVARNSALNEELGQIDYIFSDKTGTLTCNKMELLKFIVDGTEYGTGLTEIEKSNARRNGVTLIDDRPDDFKIDEDGFKFFDAKISNGNWYNEMNHKSIEEFFTLLAVCHTVIPEKGKKGEIVYQAASPDEAALVKAAAKLGFEFYERSHDHLSIRIRKKSYQYKVLNILEFSSKRKRMSIIVRDPSNRLVLLTKGADNVLLPLLTEKERNGLGRSLPLLEKSAMAGLRTLVCAKAYLDEEEYEAWNKEFEEAKLATHERDKKLEVVNERIEKNLTFLGITAIEDELQDDVPATIRDLAEAGIKLWVLTGDKQATAINIGYACDLLNNAMKVHVIEQSTQIQQELRQILEEIMRFQYDESQQFGLVVEGHRLKTILADSGLKRMFIKIGTMCNSVVCCRVSPSQKAEVVTMIRKAKKKITLSIGDGANDVPMIQAAHVGIGISGEEGLQACNASDYSFGQFRYLRNLLLVHGRWNYRRVSKLILYSFYKNTVLYLTQMWFVLFNFFSGASVHDRWTVSTYNILFTSLPIMALACFDRDIKDPDTVLRFPGLYRQGHKETFFSLSIFLSWLVNSIYHSAICFLVPYFWMRTDFIDTGLTLDKWSFGVVIYTSVLLTVTLKCALETSSFTLLHFVCIGVSIFLWFVFVISYGGLNVLVGNINPSWNTKFPFFLFVEFMGQYNPLFQPQVYCVVLLTVTLALSRDFIYKVLKRNLSSRLYYEVQRKGDTRTAEEIKSHSHERSSLLVTQIKQEGAAVRDIFTNNLLKYRGFAFSQSAGQGDLMNKQTS